MRKKKIIAMLLAGGQGTRLGLLTKDVAKPAVPFGGKYRIIDFPLSNCTNSGIDVVGVLTQFQPLELNSYIGSGQPWDLDLINGGAFVLPPYHTGKTGDWYKGTANAIYQNIPFIKQYDPDYVLILSGDHIYKMDYNAMLEAHVETGADATIAVRPVPWKDAPSFGIMNADPTGRILEFEEKPKQPKSNLASMGVYIFTWPVLKKYLEEDEATPGSKNDFGHSIIPMMLNDNKKLFAYSFEDYWKDVGTIASLWEANMDLLQEKPEFNLYDKGWRIYSRSPVQPPHYTAPSAKVETSMMTEGCEVFGEVKGSVLFNGCHIEAGAKVINSVIMPGCVIKAGTVVNRAIIAEDCVIGNNCKIGETEGDIALIGRGTEMPDEFVVAAGEQADNDSIAAKVGAAK